VTTSMAQSVHSNQSPQSRPTPTSHHSSPTSNSPNFGSQGVLTPPASDVQMQQQIQQQRITHPMKPQMNHGLPGVPGPGRMAQPLAPARKGTGSSAIGMGGPPAAYYPSGNFHTHIEQLGKLPRPLLSVFSFYRTMFVLD
jgi:hypothetical protein